MNKTDDTLVKIDQLVDGWCEHRRLKPLRYILQSYPLLSGLTDEWAALLEALKEIRALCTKELTENEAQLLGEVIGSVSDIVYREK